MNFKKVKTYFKKNNKAIILIVIALLSSVVIAYAIKKYMERKNLTKKLVPFMQKWEGGLSSAQTDNAKNNPSPYTDPKTGYKYHTNKGVIYPTFTGLASVGGYEPSKENFLTMPDEIWMKILEKGYMKPYPLDRIDHLPRMKAVFITWSWGSGTGGTEVHMADFIRRFWDVKDSNITKTEAVEIVRSKVNFWNEEKVFLEMCEERLQDFKNMSTWNVNGKGWMNRLNDFVFIMTGRKNYFNYNMVKQTNWSNDIKRLK